jgi:hypothetical protein
LSFNTRRIKVLGLVGLPLIAIAVAVLLLASTSSGTKDTEAVGPGVGMDLDCPASAPIGGNFNCTIATSTAPSVAISGWADEILAPAGIDIQSTSNSAAQCNTEIGNRTQGGGAGPPACTRGNGGAVGPTYVRHVIASAVQAPPLPSMDGITPSGTGDILATVGFVCQAPGAHNMTLTYVGAPPKDSAFGGVYFDTDANQVPIKSGDNDSVTCVVPPTATNAPTELKNVQAALSASKVLQGASVTVTGTANFAQDLDGDTVGGWGSATVNVTSTAGTTKNLTATATNAACAGATCTANVDKGGAPPVSGGPDYNESTSDVAISATVNCTAVGDHNVVVSAVFTREDGSAVPPAKSTNNSVTLPLECNPLTPPIQKLPPLSNLFLTHQHSPKLPPVTCASGDDTAVLQEVVGLPITSLDPKGSGNPQVLAAFEFEVRFDNKLVCINLEPGPGWSVPGVTCLTLDKDTSLLEGIARIACFSTKPVAPGNAALHLANIVIRPHPELYSQIRANQENGIVAQILNQDCELADQQGHPIAIFSCEDAELTIRFLEGDVDADCDVDVADGQALAFRWNALLGTLLYGTRYDLEPSLSPGGLNGDGDIDVKDIQFVFGRQGSTCANPNPPQPPENPKA